MSGTDFSNELTKIAVNGEAVVNSAKILYRELGKVRRLTASRVVEGHYANEQGYKDAVKKSALHDAARALGDDGIAKFTEEPYRGQTEDRFFHAPGSTVMKMEVAVIPYSVYEEIQRELRNLRNALYNNGQEPSIERLKP